MIYDKKNIEEKLISIIVAAYNIEDYLSRCLESILSQTYSNFEVIVVDDGSTDRTGAICDEFAGRDSRIKVIHQENMGLSGARNSALKMARGEYIGYVDGDDWIEPDMYREMWHACESQKAEIAVCAYREIGNNKITECFDDEQYCLSKEEALETYVCDNKTYHIYNSVWSKLFKRQVVDGIEFPVGRKSEDIMYTTYALINCNKCVFINTAYYNYVVDREGSIMNHGLHRRRFQDEIPFWKEQIDCFSSLGMEELSRKASYQFYKRMLYYYMDFKDRKMKDSSSNMVKLLRGEKNVIQDIYKEDFVALGDKVRMKIFLINPFLYYTIVKLYERFIIPLKQ